MKYDLITFGEAMIRLTSSGHMRLEQSPVLEVFVGGAEWNVAVNVSKLGLKTAWVSRLKVQMILTAIFFLKIIKKLPWKLPRLILT